MTNRANFDGDIKSAEHNLTEKAEALAITHHKIIYQVEQDLCMSSQLTQKRQTKTNVWNAFIWSQAQNKKNIGMSRPPMNISLINLNLNVQTWTLPREKKFYLQSLKTRKSNTTCLCQQNLRIWFANTKSTRQ